ncbi:MAG TPA: ABC transporter permease [Bryobacteraceae bacterium]|jgi:predicted permease|nr:ABC transporter permease [Bryobacteraceae bacterium]
MRWNDLLLRIQALVFRKRVERELDEELRFHLAMESRKQAAAGASDGESARLARIRFGGLEQIKEECRTTRGTQLIETVLQDVRYALKGFRRTPAFVLTVIGTIALGIGLNTALFTIFNAYVLRPLAIRDPYSLYSFTWINHAGQGHAFSWREFESFQKKNPAFSECAASRFLDARANGHPLMGELVTGNYFEMLGVNAARGRTLLPEDSAAPGRDPVIVLSYSAWKDKFGGDADIVGKKILLRGYPLEVIGIAKQGFSGLGDAPRDYWTPLTMAAQLETGPDLFGPEEPEELRIIGRIERGLTVRQAESALTGWSKQMTADRRDSEKAAAATLQSEATAMPLTPQMIAAGSPLVVAFGLVLLLACANVANMMLARAVARQREIGIRLSLGAARRRLIRQLLTESILLAIPAGLLGFIVAQTTVELSIRAMFATLPADLVALIRTVPLPPDARVFGFMIIAALVSAVAFGLAPAIQATRTDVMLAARGEFTSDVRPMRLRDALVIVQITVCVVLLICSGVLLRGADGMGRIDVGFKTRGVIDMRVGERFRARIVDQLSSKPVVQTIAAAGSTPLNGMLPAVSISSNAGATGLRASYNHVSPEYFPVLEIPILSGRNFTSGEASSGAPVAIISEATARRLWPNGDAVGQEIRVHHDAQTNWGEQLPQYQAVRVVGVARDIISCCVVHGKDPGLIYFPVTSAVANTSLLIRVNGNTEAVRRKLDAEVEALAPGSIEEIHPLDQLLAAGIYPFRALSWISCSLGGLALLLTLSGIYGVLSYLITQRTKEIGIRMALGATTGSVTRLVLGKSTRLAGVGIGLGTALSLGVARLFAAHLVVMNPFDSLAYGGSVILVAATSIAGAYFPTRRAARIDPIATLRYD